MSDYPIRILEGNAFTLTIQLEQIAWGNGTGTTSDFTPADTDKIRVSLISRTRKYACMNIEVGESSLTFSFDNGIARGMYSVQIVVYREDGIRLNCVLKDRLLIVRNNGEAGFEADVIQLTGAVLLNMNGVELQWDDTPTEGSGAVVTSNGIYEAITMLEQTIEDNYDSLDERIGDIDGDVATKIEEIETELSQKYAITSIQQTTTSTESEGVNVVTATFDNGETATFEVRNGAQGEQGVQGDTVILGDEDTYTLYNVTGTSTTGAMTQQATTRELDTKPTIATGSDADLDITDEDGNVLVRFADGDVQTKNFDSSENAMSSAEHTKLASIEDGAEVNDVVTDDATADLDITDDNGNVLVRFANGHIQTKEFDSSSIGIDTEQAISNADLDITDEDGNVLARFTDGHIKTKNFDSSDIETNVFPHPNFIGSPALYLPNYDSNTPTLFDDSSEVYAAYDALIASYPLYLSRKTDIGMDASNTYEVRRYQLGWQNPIVSEARAGTGTNEYSESTYKPLRLLLCTGCHPTETPSLYGCYMAVKAILESSEEWAMFIKSNMIIDIVPLINPWGLNQSTKNANNANGYNINRCYYDNIQQENTNMINLLAELKILGLKGVIDCHNAGYSDNDGYLVSKPTYPYWNYYVNLGQNISALTEYLFTSVFGDDSNSVDGNHFHVWDATSATGQLHDYVNNVVDVLGVTFEVRNRLTNGGTPIALGAQITSAIAINIINSFVIYNS